MATTGKKKAVTAAAVKEVKAEQVEKAAAGFSVESATNKVAAAQVEVQKKLGEVQATFSAVMADLETAREAAALKRAELKTLHDIEVSATTLAELTAGIEAARAAAKAEDEATADRRKKDEAEYKYQQGIARRAEEDAHKAKLAAKDKEYAERAAKLAEAEKELADLRALRDALPKTLRDAETKAVDAALAAERKDAQHKAALDAAAAQNKLDRAQSDLVVERVKVEALTKDNQALRAELAEANRSVKALGEKALEAASRRDALSTLERNLDREQAPVAAKGGR